MWNHRHTYAQKVYYWDRAREGPRLIPPCANSPLAWPHSNTHSNGSRRAFHDSPSVSRKLSHRFTSPLSIAISPPHSLYPVSIVTNGFLVQPLHRRVYSTVCNLRTNSALLSTKPFRDLLTQIHWLSRITEEYYPNGKAKDCGVLRVTAKPPFRNVVDVITKGKRGENPTVSALLLKAARNCWKLPFGIYCQFVGTNPTLRDYAWFDGRGTHTFLLLPISISLSWSFYSTTNITLKSSSENRLHGPVILDRINNILMSGFN